MFRVEGEERSKGMLLRNHPFDEKKSRRGKGRVAEESVSGPNAPAKGAEPIRAIRFKTNEAKIPAHIRLGLTLN